MKPNKPLVIALRRNAEIEHYISEELNLSHSFCELFDSNLNKNSVDCIWVDMTTNLDAVFLDQFSNLKFIVTATTGLTHLKLSQPQLNRVKIVSLKGEVQFLEKITSTAEFAWALAMTVWRRIPLSSSKYDREISIRTEFSGLQLNNLSIGTIGFGRLGKMLSSYARAFGMKTKYFDPYINFEKKASARELLFKCETIEELCSTSDMIFLVASHENQRIKDYPILNRDCLSLVQPHAIVINVSRGSLLDEDALADFISEGKIFGAGIDVLHREELPVKDKSRLQELQNSGHNVVVTPHLGGMCRDAFESANRFTAKKLFLEIKNLKILEKRKI